MKLKKFIKSGYDAPISMIAKSMSKTELKLWANQCVSSIFNTVFYYELSDDERQILGEAFNIVNSFSISTDGNDRLSLKKIRSVSLAVHKIARRFDNAESIVAHLNLRAIGQAIATWHAKDHAIVAAMYACSAEYYKVLRFTVSMNGGVETPSAKDAANAAVSFIRSQHLRSIVSIHDTHNVLSN